MYPASKYETVSQWAFQRFYGECKILWNVLNKKNAIKKETLQKPLCSLQPSKHLMPTCNVLTEKGT